jgi:hypothetical protein
MTPETRAYVLKIVDNVRAWKAEEDAKEPERLRLKLESHLALERLHQAVAALKATQP